MFSTATFLPTVRQKKRRINAEVFRLSSSGVSQRRMARLLNVHMITIARKLVFLATQSKERNLKFLQNLTQHGKVLIQHVQFDELETFEQTKCKPLSVALMVSDDPKTKRAILGFEISSMPAKGPLAQISREKYGFRADERSKGLKALFKKTAPYLTKSPHIVSDQNPRYPSLIHNQWEESLHVAVKGRRGCSVGQGELKKIGFDPLFSLNHTCAMLRANINRLFRKTWCTTKKLEKLRDHLEIYIDYHNHTLLNLAV